MNGRWGMVAALLVSSVLLAGALHAQDAHVMPETVEPETAALLHDVREATAVLHDVAAAEEAGYGVFQNCFRHGEGRGMGQHYVNGALMDDVLEPTQPEALVYEPLADGELVLVAFEYIVPAEAWDPDDAGREPPTLFGQEFSLKTNIPDTPPIWALHVWLWSHNPEGLYADFNPIIVCPADEPFTDFSEM